MLEAINVSYSYGANDALRNVSASFAAGSLAGILGPNGSGKSTLVKLLARVAAPSAGEVRYGGKSLREWRPKEYAQKVGYLPQENEIAFPMRAYDVVLAGRAPYLGRFQTESSVDHAIAEAALAECDAEQLRDRYVHEMSGGEKKRVLLARVLAGNPETIVLDEPLASLDLAHADQLSRLLRRIVEKGRSVVVVSHDFNWAASCCDRVLLMHRGALVAHATPREVLTSATIKAYFDVEVEVVEQRDGRAWLLPAFHR